MKEYIVTARSFEDLESLYDDLETEGGDLYIPGRSVHCCQRRPISRNTHYMLTEDEADLLKKDPRVLDVESKELIDSILIEPHWTQTSSNWNKDLYEATSHKNWALYRCITGSQVPNWGDDGDNDVSGTVSTTSSGKNVDVVIMDGHIDPSHPEFAINPDGTGGSRIVQFNWYSLTSQVTGGSNGTYQYPTGVDLENSNENHGIHVAGTACGNTQGWARDSTIYNISPYSNNINTLAVSYTMDYVRVWHNNKSINPDTGFKNPTIVNMSFGSSYTFSSSLLTNVNWRGANYTSGLTDTANLDSWGLTRRSGSNIIIPAYVTSWAVDLEDAINAGIILVGSAGNSSMRVDDSSGTDYNNTVTWSGLTRYYHRGDYRFSQDTMCIGAVGAKVIEYKNSGSTGSNYGTRITVFAPGDNIISAVHSGTYEVDDPRDSNYKLEKKSGTSMASPQVCGVLACALEQYPRMNQTDCIEYITTICDNEQVADGGGGYTDTTSVAGTVKRYLFYKKERPEEGTIQPRPSYRLRTSTGQTWPRVSVFKYKK